MKAPKGSLLKKIFFCTAAVLFCGCAVQEDEITVTQTGSKTVYVSEAEVSAADERLLSCRYFDGKDFDTFAAGAVTYDVDGEIMCATVPHHLLAGRLIAGLFRTAEATRPDVDTVIIVATMHEPKNEPLYTTLLGWNTPFGSIAAGREISEGFISELGAKENDNMLEKDHSASSIIPFVKYYYPEAKVSCLLVAENADRDIPERLSQLIAEKMDTKSCLTIFSIDFSHYLDIVRAKKHDEETLAAVMNSDYDTIASMTNSNVDSAPCLESFTRLSDASCAEKITLDHSNSLEISGDFASAGAYGDGVTSYYIFAGIK